MTRRGGALVARIRQWLTDNFSGGAVVFRQAAVLLFALVAGTSLSATYWPGTLGGAVLSAAVLALTELGFFLADKLFRRYMGRSPMTLAALALLAGSVVFTVKNGAGEGWSWRVLLFSALVTGSLWLLTVSWWGLVRYRRFTPTAIAAALLSAGMAILLSIFFFTDGFDDHILRRYLALSPDRDNRVESLDLSLGYGMYPVETLDYGPGESLEAGTMDLTVYMDRDTDDLTGNYVDAFMEYDLTEVPMRGRVWYPAGGEDRPVLFIAHGNHEITTPSYQGYAYLGEYLASHGYVVVSVDHNACNMLSGENDGRAVLLLEHIGLLLGYNGEQGNPLYGILDPENIAIAGHSRGGEMVATAYLFNRYDRYPENGSVTFDYNYNIKSIIAIAPTVNQYRPAGHSVELQDVNYLLLHGAADRDVTSFMGMAQYENISYTGQGEYLKSALYIAGANHGQFNSLWGAYDQTGPFSPLLNVEGLLSEADQQQVARLFIKVFLDVTLLGDDSNRALLTDWRQFAGQLPETVYVQCHGVSGFTPLADFEEDSDLETASREGITLSAQGFNWWTEERLGLAGSSVYDAHALRLRWNEEASYHITTQAQDLNGKSLSFDISHRDNRSVESGWYRLLNADIELRDALGNTATAKLSDYATVFPVLPVRTDKLDYLFETQSYKPAFTTVAIPAEDFVPDGEEIDLSRITGIAFRFAGSGQVGMDNIGIVAP